VESVSPMPHPFTRVPSRISAPKRLAPLGSKHTDVSTTMIYTHVLNRGGRGVHSPADGLGFSQDRLLGEP